MPAGERYGTLVIVGDAPNRRTPDGESYTMVTVRCTCGCGGVFEVTTKNLRSGNTAGCGGQVRLRYG